MSLVKPLTEDVASKSTDRLLDLLQGASTANKEELGMAHVARKFRLKM